ncbi:Long-chain-fatty-acid--CoA ligase [Patulibacter medicamentivorans]|uniref:Long-chain-fatty-acid--CoA ligase n=1 Tax=Patulibacter medicamentivorans TaxID=1097667 RepID=H0E5U1_9ACTN|nr:long-chain fatty acid--CoA ligase [Patulibacter medicamentivorans]EHN10961.1 Long-chain-fatty-acid--CoA ligase [Patulibacter medicamentivorans]
MATDAPNANLATLLTESAAKHPDRIAIRLDDVAVPYAALDAGSQRVAGLLRDLGVEPGDRVGIMLPNVPHFPLAYYGALRLGAVVVPMNPLLSKREVAYYLDNSEAKLLLAWHGFAESAEGGADQAEIDARVLLVEPADIAQRVAAAEPIAEVAQKAGDDTAVVLYTSGTTGHPKGAELTHHSVGSNVEACLDLFRPTEQDVFFGGLPFFHVFGQTATLNVAVAVGAEVTLLPRFDPTQALEIVQRDKVSIFMGVPTMHGAILHHPKRTDYDTSSLRLFVSGGSALPVEVLKGVKDAFATPILEGYGLSETSPVASFSRIDLPQKPGSIGVPISGVEMRLVDDAGVEVPVGEVGELQIKGPNVMKGYWRNPEATANAIDEDGWFSSGDMAKKNEDGFYFIVDRKKDLIIRGGYNVYPREVEEVLYEHPAVSEAAVIGLPHESLGEEVGAAVALKAGQQVSEDELQAFVKEQVAAYKYPRRVWIVEELPKGPTGKILKRQISAPEGGA